MLDFIARAQAVSLAAVTAVVLSATPAAFAATGIELTDKRVENQTGLQLIYEVRRTWTTGRTRPVASIDASVENPFGGSNTVFNALEALFTRKIASRPRISRDSLESARIDRSGEWRVVEASERARELETDC